MALHLNLLHEIAKHRAERRRDPLKISAMVLGGIVALFVALYLWEYQKFSSANKQLLARKAVNDQVQPKAKAAKDQEQALQQTIRSGELLMKRVEGRFFWAPLLDQFARVVPREVQITKLQGDVQGESVKKCQITIDGISAGTDPRRVAEDLRLALAESFGKKYKNVTAAFRQLEDGTSPATVDGQRLPTATFAIAVQLEAGEEVVATPAPRGSKKKRAGEA